VIEAYVRGLTARAEAGAALDTVGSVASFFLSRIDTKVDERLPEGSPLRGRVALASARVA
jgi:transaldolase